MSDAKTWHVRCRQIEKELSAEKDKVDALEAGNAALRLKVQEYNSALDAMTARYVVLEALVTALPVLDMHFDSVVTVHGGWVVGGAMFGKRVEADTYAALLTHRQSLT